MPNLHEPPLTFAVFRTAKVYHGRTALVEFAETSVPFGNFGKLSYRSGNEWCAQGTEPLVELAETSGPFGKLSQRGNQRQFVL